MIPAKEINVSRQYPLVGTQRFDISQLESGVAVAFAKIPFNSIITGGYLLITTAFDSGTTDTITIGDDGGTDGTADPDRYLVGGDGQALGPTAIVPTGFQFTTLGNLTMTWTSAGTAPTVGAGLIVFEYVTEGRHSFEVVPSY